MCTGTTGLKAISYLGSARGLTNIEQANELIPATPWYYDLDFSRPYGCFKLSVAYHPHFTVVH